MPGMNPTTPLPSLAGRRQLLTLATTGAAMLVAGCQLLPARHGAAGDPVYRRGTWHGLAFPRQALHAGELTLTHPRTGKSVTWRAPLPRDMKRLPDTLRKEA